VVAPAIDPYGVAVVVVVVVVGAALARIKVGLRRFLSAPLELCWLIAGAPEAGEESRTPAIVSASATRIDSCFGRLGLMALTVLNCRQRWPLHQTAKVMTT
jgi:hypothetical protein